MLPRDQEMERRAIGGLRPWRRGYTTEWFETSGKNGTIKPLEEVSPESGTTTGISPERKEWKSRIRAFGRVCKMRNRGEKKEAEICVVFKRQQKPKCQESKLHVVDE